MIVIQHCEEVSAQNILWQRQQTQPAGVQGVVRGILDDVRLRGDAAVLDYTEKFDGVRPKTLRVTQEEVDRACKAVDPVVLAAMREAAENIADFHRRQVRQGFINADKEGIVVGQRVLPLMENQFAGVPPDAVVRIFTDRKMSAGEMLVYMMQMNPNQALGVYLRLPANIQEQMSPQLLRN